MDSALNIHPLLFPVAFQNGFAQQDLTMTVFESREQRYCCEIADVRVGSTTDYDCADDCADDCDDCCQARTPVTVGPLHVASNPLVTVATPSSRIRDAPGRSLATDVFRPPRPLS